MHAWADTNYDLRQIPSAYIASLPEIFADHISDFEFEPRLINYSDFYGPSALSTLRKGNPYHADYSPVRTIEELLERTNCPSSQHKMTNKLAHQLAYEHTEIQESLDTDAKKELYAKATHEFGLKINFNKNTTVHGAMMRLTEPRTWRRRIETEATKEVERRAFTGKKLGKNKDQKCVSDHTLKYFEIKDEAAEEYLNTQNLALKSSLKENEDPIIINLGEIAAKNRNSKEAEIYLTLKSFEHIAKDEGKDWVFLTFTCPPEYHPNPTNGADNYDPDNDFAAGIKYLQNCLRLFLKKLDRVKDGKFKRGIDFFGLKVFEVHQDGCPHLHVLMYFNPEMNPEIKKGYNPEIHHIFREMKSLFTGEVRENYFENNSENIIKFGKKEDDEDGKAAKASSYIYKYIVAAINPDSDNLTAKRYKAAFRASRARQYEFFGINGSLTKRRMLLKASKMESGPTELLKQAKELHIQQVDDKDSEKKKERLENQLKASIRFIQKGHEEIELVEEETVNRYGETVKRASGIKHKKDSIGVNLSDRYFLLSKEETKKLKCENRLIKNITILDVLTVIRSPFRTPPFTQDFYYLICLMLVLQNHFLGTVSTNYSRVGQTQEPTPETKKIGVPLEIPPTQNPIIIKLGDLNHEKTKNHAPTQADSKNRCAQVSNAITRSIGGYHNFHF